MKNLLGILLIMSLLSCETLIEDLPLNRFPQLKSKLVLTSFISPQDTAISVTLSQSVPLFGEYPKPKTQKVVDYKGDSINVAFYNDDYSISDAQIMITDGEKSAIIPFDLKTRAYYLPAAKFPIKAGKTYTLSAKTKELFVEASTTVPLEYVKIGNVKIDTTYEKSEFWERNAAGQGMPVQRLIKVVNVEFDWNDAPQIKNYYKVEGYIESPIQYALLEKKEIVYKTYPTKYFANWDGKNYAPKKKYVNDDNLDGKLIFSPKGKITIYPFDPKNGSTFDGKFYPAKVLTDQRSIKITLLNLNKDFYQNQLTLESFFSADGNPFAEPVQVYGNVKNGLGCFGAYNISSLQLPFK